MRQRILTGVWKKLVWLLVPALVLTAGGCTMRPKAGGTVSIATPDFFGIGEDVALQLVSNFRRPNGKGMRIIMTTLVDIDDLYQTSRFGRTFAEALSTRLFRHGFGVVEIRKSSEVLIKSASGELMLSRDAALLAKQYAANAIVAGTYSLTPNSVIINVKLLDSASQDVLSVAGLEIQRSRNINHLLTADSAHSEAMLSAYER